MTPNDATLWSRWLERRDPDSLAELFSRHAGMVFATCRRILGNAADAEDAAQECFADLLRARGDVRASLAAWLHTIAVRRSLDLRKAERRRREREQAAVPGGAAPERDREREELLALLDAAIDDLPPRLRVPVVRRFLSGETHTAIALELGVSEATVRYRIEKGIASLRRALARRGVQAAPVLLVAALGDLVASAPAGLSARLGKMALEAGALPPAVSTAALATWNLLAWSGAAKLGLGGAALLAVAAAAGTWVATRPSVLEPRGSDRPVSAIAAGESPRDGIQGADPGTAPVVVETATATPLPQEAAWRIRCVDAEGRAVPGAEVTLIEASTLAFEAPRAISSGSATTDADGLASFARETQDGERAIRAYARLPGRLAGFVAEQPARPGNVLEIRMTTISPVVGYVEPPPGFDPRRVTIRIPSLDSLEAYWGPSFVRWAGVDGRFDFQDLPAGSHVELIAEAEGLGRARATVPSPRPADLRIEMFLEGMIAGTLVYDDTSAPAAGVPLEATSSDSFETETDRSGRFAFRGLSDDLYRIGLPLELDLPGWTLAARGPVRAVPGTVTDGINLRLERGALVTGTVADAATRRPLRATVCARAAEKDRPAFEACTRTDDEGRYALSVPHGEFDLDAFVSEPAYPNAQTLSVSVSETGTLFEHMDFLLDAVPAVPVEPPPQPRFGSVRGRVVDIQGKPLRDVPIQSKPHEFRDHVKWTNSDAEGRYELEVPAGTWIVISAGGGRYSRTSSGTFEVNPDESLEIEDLVVGSGSGSLAGVVVDPAGEPVAQATVLVGSKSKESPSWTRNVPRSDREGRFRVERLFADEPLRVNINKPGYHGRIWLGVLREETDLRFVLHPDSDPATDPEAPRAPDPDTLIGLAAPPWEVAEWVGAPPNPARPDRGDGRETLLVFEPFRFDWSGWGKDLRLVEDLCRGTGAVPVAILPCSAHASSARRARAEHGLALAIGIDAYPPGFATRSVTALRYGKTFRGGIFRIDASGIVRGHARKVGDAGDLFGK